MKQIITFKNWTKNVQKLDKEPFQLKLNYYFHREDLMAFEFLALHDGTQNN